MFAEAGAEFLKPLQDTSVTEFETATMECELSKSNVKVTWFKDGAELKKSERIEMKSKDRKHVLTVHNAQMSDNAGIKVVAENAESSANLIVHGEYWEGFCILDIFLRVLMKSVLNIFFFLGIRFFLW